MQLLLSSRRAEEMSVLHMSHALSQQLRHADALAVARHCLGHIHDTSVVASCVCVITFRLCLRFCIAQKQWAKALLMALHLGKHSIGLQCILTQSWCQFIVLLYAKQLSYAGLHVPALGLVTVELKLVMCDTNGRSFGSENECSLMRTLTQATYRKTRYFQFWYTYRLAACVILYWCRNVYCACR